MSYGESSNCNKLQFEVKAEIVFSLFLLMQTGWPGLTSCYRGLGKVEREQEVKTGAEREKVDMMEEEEEERFPHSSRAML